MSTIPEGDIKLLFQLHCLLALCVPRLLTAVSADLLQPLSEAQGIKLIEGQASEEHDAISEISEYT